MKLTFIIFFLLILYCSCILYGQNKQTSIPLQNQPSQSITFIKGEHPSKFLKRNPQIVTKLKQLLGKVYPIFETGLSVSSGLETQGNYYILYGCAPHMCGSQMSHIAFEKSSLSISDLKISVIVYNDEWVQPLRFYSNNTNKKVPIELALLANADTPENDEKILLPNYMFQPFENLLKSYETKLFPDYLGNSLWRIFKSLKERNNRVFYKDEFETTEEFKVRRENELSKPILDSLTIKDKLAFRIFNPSKSYDADQAELTIGIPITPCNFDSNTIIGDSDFTCISVFESENVSSYKTKDTYNRQITITKTNKEIYGLILPQTSNWERKILNDAYEYAPENLIFRVPMQAKLAKKVKENLSLLLIGNLIEPYVANGHFAIEPTILKPFEEIRNKHFLVFQLDSIFLFDPSNGELIHRIVNQ